MATMRVDGIDEMMRNLEKIQENMRGAAMKDMLEGGAKIIKEEWQQSIGGKGGKRHVVTGAMQNSIQVTDLKLDLGGGSIKILPDGYDNRGVANDLKANVIISGLHGTKDDFKKRAEQAASPRVIQALQGVLDSYTKG